MCKPTFYEIRDEINPWKNRRIKAEQLQAAVQWKQLHDVLENWGVEIAIIEPQQDLPGMIFTAHAGIVIDNKVLLSHYRNSQRQKESYYFKQWFIKSGYEILDIKAETRDYCFEADAVITQKQVFAGFGIRSDKGYYENLELLFDGNIIYCELVNPYFYHLNTCFNPLDGEVGIWWPEAFAYTSQLEMYRSLDLIAIPEQEAKQLACQAIVVNRNIVLPKGCPETEKILQQLGYEVYSCNMTEFLKAGAACQSLLLKMYPSNFEM